jgi:paraquat-inducible protein B
MSAQAKPFRVGVFVIGAVALVLGGLIAFGSGDQFKERTRFVGFFPGSVAGLRPGAQVAFRGVPVGSVTRIAAQYEPQSQNARVAVYFEGIRGSIDDFSVAGEEDIADEISKLIELGLRAQLVPQSFVTGQLYLELEMRPDTEMRLYGDAAPGIIEMPTIPSTIDVLDTQLKSLLGADDSGGLGELITHLDRIASAENAQAITNILRNLDAFTAALGGRQADVASIIDNASSTIEKIDQAVGEVEALVGDGRTAVQAFGAVATDLDDPETGLLPVIATARDAAASVGRMADQINNAVAENRPGFRDFSDGTLPAIDDVVLDLERLAQTLNRVADQLERDPSGFLLGRGQREGIR